MASETNNKQPQTLYDEKTVQSLSKGLLENYEPCLTQVKTQLSEISEKQNVLIDQLHDENLKLSWSQNSVELQEMIDTITGYHSKLKSIKKDMKSIHDRSNKLKKRAVRLQHFHEKEEYIKQVELKKEIDLIAKPK